jgi:hypothetical protein
VPYEEKEKKELEEVRRRWEKQDKAVPVLN